MFRLKTAALAATMAAAALSAQASDVEVFGRLDTGVLYTVNQGDAKDTLKLMAAYQKGWDLDRIGAFQAGSKLTQQRALR